MEASAIREPRAVRMPEQDQRRGKETPAPLPAGHAAGTGALGGPVLDPSGKVLGITLTKKDPSGAGKSLLAMAAGMTTVVLPTEDIQEAAKQAPEVEEVEEEPTEPEGEPKEKPKKEPEKKPEEGPKKGPEEKPGTEPEKKPEKEPEKSPEKQPEKKKGEM